jgi:hypothetical protein
LAGSTSRPRKAVTNNAGVLGGYAWGANTGWINFAGVTIDSNGLFHGSTTAQSLFGTMTFDCAYCNIIIDTTQIATDTIDYVATDTWGNTATSTRTVIIEACRLFDPITNPFNPLVLF